MRKVHRIKKDLAILTFKQPTVIYSTILAVSISSNVEVTNNTELEIFTLYIFICLVVVNCELVIFRNEL